jgi:hypothetical protein
VEEPIEMFEMDAQDGAVFWDRKQAIVMTPSSFSRNLYMPTFPETEGRGGMFYSLETEDYLFFIYISQLIFLSKKLK